MEMAFTPPANVGASLLAMAIVHSKQVLADPPPSRASSLPQEIGVLMEVAFTPPANVGASLLANAD
jgi:hypothetical protein